MCHLEVAREGVSHLDWKIVLEFETMLEFAFRLLTLQDYYNKNMFVILKLKKNKSYL